MNKLVNLYRLIGTVSVTSIFLSLTCVAQKDDFVKTYSKEDFMSEVNKRNNFVMFFAPWCSHCKTFSPVWEDLAKDLSESSNIAVAKVDCTIHTELCSNQDITGYPTLKLYKTGAVEGKKFRGSRDVPTLKRFINEELGDEADLPSTTTEGVTVGPVELTDDTFLDHVSQGNHFVKFFAPWCSHCQNLAPTWHELAVSVKDGVTVAKIDCTQSQKVCSMFNVMSYPTLLWIQNGEQVDAYQGERSLGSLQEYVAQMLKPNEQRKTEKTEDTADSEKSVVALTEGNFYSSIENGVTFVKFFAPWCGHCKRLAPTWEELAKTLSSEGKVKIAHVDCTLEENKDLCNDQEVEGYPTLFLYKNGVKVSEYNGSRVLEDLIEFVKRHSSSHDEL
ncbi:thioredoxin domain-containing protein 5 homolog [Macrosteles quadrilineatus]|uniref:thioredoxin domain-containing protein 5 homolog n=1 Tax=Macrosteles quadrilineatus TaxID=74068 RepID=UPI0023E14A50|nr:thioredoxin domain-containing protein 5 homolog [Macrosteles quadrilineatus]